MIEANLKKPGKLVKFRGRRCVVQPSDDHEIILLKPLGGMDDEIIAIFEPVLEHHEKIEEDTFELPGIQDLDSFITAKLLYDAARLSFRQVSGPFRAMGKLSFRPRSYQLVPLIMALKQRVTRLLIADDVGIGKTIEALIILRELLERGIITNFAVLCPPHLCDQWQKELADKLDIDTEIIRSSTVAGLERRIVGDDSATVFNYYPYQVVSIDYVKSDNKKTLFLMGAPQLIIVDEAHTCAKPDNQRDNQQQRFHLLKKLTSDKSKHFLFLTATPHSGKDSEFQSLLALLNDEFGAYNLNSLTTSEKRKLASHFIQRKRGNIIKWLDEETPFPDRNMQELIYNLSDEYSLFYQEVWKFAKGITIKGKEDGRSRIKNFAVINLLRGVMSSPETGGEMLQRRRDKSEAGDPEIEKEINPEYLVDKLDEQSDTLGIDIIDNAGLTDNEWNILSKLSAKIRKLDGLDFDFKIKTALTQLKLWIDNGQSPIVFCRFIATAEYVAGHLRLNLPVDIDIRAITSELSDEERKEKIEEMGKSRKRILVATDCLSEGINLQDKFNAILHYDLPWNPNRLQQREGRVDRFGQTGWIDKHGVYKNIIEIRILFSEDNPIDTTVLRVIIDKIQRIQNTSGVSISLADDNRSVIDKVLKEVLLNPENAKKRYSQLKFDFSESTLDEIDSELTKEIEAARDKAERIRSIFAHENIMPEEVKKDLQEVDEAIGNVAALESFVISASKLLGARLDKIQGGYIFYKNNMESFLLDYLGTGDKIHISFESPTPQNFRYIGRNHRFVEQLCHRILANSLDKQITKQRAARASAFRTDSVQTLTTLVQFRVRNVIREVGNTRETVAEEMFLWGYENVEEGIKPISIDLCKELLKNANAIDLSMEQQTNIFNRELTHFNLLRNEFFKVVEDRANELINAHTRFSKYLGAKRFEAVVPILPPDVLGIYILIPNPRL